jgi:NAD(P)-dependent dehydrogenase (short-subunit alcohol dehydrogenase family)
MEFTPHTAIVTGSDSGIGRATAVALASAGLDVGITWLDDEEGAQATADEVREVGRKAVVRRFDAADAPRCADDIEELIDELGGVDVFINNAGTGDNASVLETRRADHRHLERA